MKPIPLRNLAAPSPSVLKFLRAQVQNAFELPNAQCAALRGGSYRYVSTCLRDGKASGFGSQNCIGSGGEGGKVVSQGFATPTTPHLESRLRYSALHAPR